MGRWKVLVSVLLVLLVAAPLTAHAARTVYAVKTAEVPSIDGDGGEAAWAAAGEETIRDARLGVDIRLKALHTGQEIFFLVSFPDAGEDRLHKPWDWNKDLEAYQIGHQREDTSVFKWSMSGNSVDLSNFSDDDYRADVWYWKANRTDPAGFADDKSHILSGEEGKKSLKLTSRSRKTRYLVRLGDAGTSAQEKLLLTDYQGDVHDQYASRRPDGSRADVRARGVWKNGRWTVEFARRLDTGNDDDIRLDPGNAAGYLLGVSIAGLYGEPVDEGRPHPYGQGRISEPLNLKFR